MAHKISNDDLAQLIKTSKGFVTTICKNAGISRVAFYKRMKNNPKLQQVLDDAREGIVEFAESKLLKLIEEGHYPSIRFYLETQGKNKGYTIKHEVDNNVTVQNIVEVPELAPYEPTIEEITGH